MKQRKTIAGCIAPRHRFHPLGSLCWILLALLIICGRADGQQIVAHRGASRDAPENTLAAFRLAWQLGADAIEGDFYLTKDGQIACIHDADTKRTAGVSMKVAESTLAELRDLDVGRWKHEKFADEKIPTIEEVLAIVPKGKRILIEIKCGPEIVPVLREVLSRSKLLPQQIAVIAFRADVIAASKKQLPHIKAYWLTGYRQDKITGVWQPTIEKVLETLRQTGADGLDTNSHRAVVNAAFVKRLRAAGMEFHCWTVDAPAEAARLQALGVDSITTNRPAFLRAQLPTPGLYKTLDVHLKLDGNLKDDSSHHRSVTFTGRAKPIFRPAVFGPGLDCQTNSGTLSVKTKLSSQGSICMWYYARDWYNYQTIFDNSVDPQAWEMWIYETGQLRFRINPDGAVVSHQFHRTGDVNEWHHIAVTWDRHDKTTLALRLYVNGHLSESAPWKSNRWTTPGDRFFLGGGNSGNNLGNGMWDDVGIFHTVLRQKDVRVIMSGGIDSLKPQP